MTQAPTCIKIIPFSEGTLGQQFSMRLYAIDALQTNPDQNIWLAMPIAEFLCTVGGINGVISKSPLLLPTERVCSEMTLTAGDLGLEGHIVSFGAAQDLTAWADAEIAGANLLWFDFQTLEQPFGMNALYGFN